MQWHERIGRRIRLRDLHVLMAAADAGTMAKAAAELGISQPAVSKSIAETEQTLGVRLLDRGTKGLVPTEYGRALLQHAVTVFDELRRAADELHCLADPTSGQVRLGCSESMAAGLLPAIIAHMTNQYPKITLHAAQISFAPLQFRELRERAIDLVLGRVPWPLPEGDLDGAALFDERIHIVAGTQNRWARRRRIELSELVDEPWALPPPDSLPGKLVADAFRARGLDPPTASIVTASIHLLANALPTTGSFLSVAPTSVLRFNRRLPLKVLPVDFPVEPGRVGIVWMRHRTLSPVARLFVECARDLIQSDRQMPPTLPGASGQSCAPREVI
jgi:DNA-binding transcriptional LysR family regulator